MSNKIEEIRAIPISKIRAGGNDRTTFPAATIKALAISIEAYGQIVPIIVRSTGRESRHSIVEVLGRLVVKERRVDEYYELIAGERRLRACQQLGRTHIDAVIRNIGDDAASMAMLIENTGREQLRPVEEARAYRRRLDQSKITINELANIVGVSRETIRKRLNLLRLPDHVLHLVNLGSPNGIPLWVAEEMDGINPDKAASMANYYANNEKTLNRNSWARFCQQVKDDQSQATLDNSEPEQFTLGNRTEIVKRLDAATIDEIRVLLAFWDSYAPNHKVSKLERVRAWLASK